MEAHLAGNGPAEVLRVGMEGSQRKVMGDGDSRADGIVDVAIRMAMSGNTPTSTIDGSGEPCVIDCNAEGLFLAFGKERWNVSKEDFHSLWRRFEEWTVRPDQAADFAPFFEDLNRWGVDGHRVIRKTAALLLFARGLVKDAERMRSENFWGRLQAQVPLRRHFAGEGGRPSYWVEISLAGDALLFEKECRVIRFGPEEVRQVWHRFVEWWCLPSPEGEDERAGLDFGSQLGGDAGFYGFELACLMNELEQSKVVARRG